MAVYIEKSYIFVADYYKSDYTMIKYTPEIISELKPNEIFVFGSNTAGMHGAGAARVAHRSFGAEMGVGEGLTGQTYAFPTLDANLNQVKEAEFRQSMKIFIRHVLENPDKTYYLTKIGCGIAGWSIEEVRGFLWSALDEENHSKLPKNLIIPIEFRI